MNKSIRTFIFGLAATVVAVQPIAAVDFATAQKAVFNIAGGLGTYWAGDMVYTNLFPQRDLPFSKTDHLFNKDQKDFVGNLTKATAGFVAKNFLSSKTGSSSPYNKIIFANIYSGYSAAKEIGSAAFSMIKKDPNIKKDQNSTKNQPSIQAIASKTAFGVLGVARGVFDAFITSKLEGKIDIGSYDFSPMTGITNRSMTKQLVRNMFATANNQYYNEDLNEAWATVGNIGGTLYFAYLKSLQPTPGMFAWLFAR